MVKLIYTKSCAVNAQIVKLVYFPNEMLIKTLFLGTFSNNFNTSLQSPATSDFWFFLQLEILTNLANEANISTILREFQVGLLSLISWWRLSASFGIPVIKTIYYVFPSSSSGPPPPCRPMWRARIRRLRPPQFRPLAAAPPTSPRWRTRVWTAWCCCCPTETVKAFNLAQ